MRNKFCDRATCLTQVSLLLVSLWSFSPIASSSGVFANRQEHSVKPSTVDASDTELISVTGIVVDEDDQPIADAIVYLRERAVLRNLELDKGRRHLFTSERKYTFTHTATDQSGEFQFNQIKPPPFAKPSKQSRRWTLVAEVSGRPRAWVKLTQSQPNDPVRLVVPPGTEINGVVRDSKGQPIPNANVYVDEISQPRTRIAPFLESPNQFIYRNSVLSPRTTTDAEGRFAILGLPLDRRIGIAFIHNDFVSQIEYAGTTPKPQPPIQQTKIQQGGYVTKTYPIQFGEMQIELRKGHRLTGRLVDQDDRGVANQDFDLLLTPSNEMVLITSDADGRFATHRFDNSLALLRVKVPNDDRYVDCEKGFQFSPLEFEKQVVFKLPVARTIRGTLESEDSKPIAQAKIVFIPEVSRIESGFLKNTTTVVTNDSGEYEMRVSAGSGVLVPVGPAFGYELSTMDQVMKFRRGELERPPKSWGRIDPSSFANATAQNKFEIAHVDLLGSPSQIVTGKILSENGEPVANATIDAVDGLFEWNGPFHRMNREQIRKLFHTQTDDQGNFQINGIPRNSRAVFAALDPETANVALIYVDQLNSFDGVEVKLTQGVVVTGKVNLNGSPHPDATVFLTVIGEYKIAEDGESSPEQIHWGQVKTDANGIYRFTGLPAKASYFVNARIDNQMDDSRNPKFDESNQTIEVPDFEFQSLNASITGVVVDPSGNPVAGVQISASKTKGGQQLNNSTLGGSSIYSDANGSFQIGELPGNTAVTIRAYMKPERIGITTFIRAPAQIEVMTGDKDVRVILDPRLAKKIRRIQ